VSLEGPSFYDDDAIFQTYMKRHERTDTPNDTLELPVVEELLGNVAGQDVEEVAQKLDKGECAIPGRLCATTLGWMPKPSSKRLCRGWRFERVLIGRLGLLLPQF